MVWLGGVAPAIVLTMLQLPGALTGTEYDSGPMASAQVLGCGRGMPYYRLVEGQMPAGLALRPGGSLVGRPERAGSHELIFEIDNGCTRTLLPVRLAVAGRGLLAVFDKEMELSQEKPRSETRVYSDHAGLAYSAEPSVKWLRVRPLMGRTPRPGEALAADLLSIEVDQAALEAELNPDGPRGEREGVVRLYCFRCRGTEIRVVLR